MSGLILTGALVSITAASIVAVIFLLLAQFTQRNEATKEGLATRFTQTKEATKEEAPCHRESA